MKIVLFIAIISQKKTDLCLSLPQRLQETFAHKNKHQKLLLNRRKHKQGTQLCL